MLFAATSQFHRLTHATFALGMVTILALAACSNNDPVSPSEATAEKESPEPYRYGDRDLWGQLPGFDYDFGDESLHVHAVEDPSAEHKQIFLFLGETAVPNNGDALAMQKLATLRPQSAVWYIDIPDAFFLPRERTSMRNNEGRFMLPILRQLATDFSRVTLLTMDVMAVPVLRGIRQWQAVANSEELSRLNHLILLYPSLYINTPVAGESRALFPIATQSAVPITVVQPELGAQANAIGESIDALGQLGAPIQLERIANATDGIYKYQDIREMAIRGAEVIDRCDRDMASLVAKTSFRMKNWPAVDFSKRPLSKIIAGLVPRDGAPMPNIELADLDGRLVNLEEDYAGKALLLTFWATWCPHCVEEIPSMNRALAQLDSSRFAMVSVSYKDTEAIMRNFMRKTRIDFPVLMDFDGKLSETWKIYSFPSSFLIDRQGRIRYSINTGAIWDSPDMLEKLREISND